MSSQLTSPDAPPPIPRPTSSALQSLLADLPSFSTDSQFHASVSRAYASNGRLPEAECFAYSSIRLNPTIPDGFLALSSTFALLGFPYDAVLASSTLSDSPSNLIPEFDLQPVPFSFPVMHLLTHSPQFQQHLENPAILAVIQEIRITRTVPESPLVVREMLEFVFNQLISDDSFFSCDCPPDCVFPNPHLPEPDVLTEPRLLNGDPIEPSSAELAVRAASQKVAETIGDVRLEAVLDRGSAFAGVGAMDAALGDFEAVLQVNAYSVRALLGAAMAELALGKLMDACDGLVRVLEVEHENQEALSGFGTLLGAVNGVRLPQERRDLTRLKLARCKCAQNPAVKSFVGRLERGSRLEGSLADPEFRELLRALMDDGLLV